MVLLGLAIAAPVNADEHSADANKNTATFAIISGTVLGHGPSTLVVRKGRIESISSDAVGESMPTVQADKRFIAPAFIDSHVHLAYKFSALELARGGIAAAVDLAAPLPFLARDLKPLQVLLAGPMVTAVTGYPTKSWGAEGYGLEVSGESAARAAVDQLFAAGARVIKIPVGDATGNGALSMAKNPSMLSDAELKAIVEQAHSHGMKVASHALNDIDVQRAAAAGVDVLAHTPTERLSDKTIASWSGRAVISTLAAFRELGEPARNLRRLREAGAVVLYGTDMGYTTFPGINPLELGLLAKAGLDNKAMIAAGTTSPAKFWGFDNGVGTLAEGHTASFLILDADPEVDPLTLSRPIAVYLDGRLIDPGVAK